MWKRDNFMISTAKEMLDFAVIYNFISQEAYWGLGRSRESMTKAIDNSLYCFGVYQLVNNQQKQIGFARVVSDLTTFGYIADVFILKPFRGKGLGKWLISTIIEHPELKTVARFTLLTRTPEFYQKSGFKIFDASTPLQFLERKQNNI